MVGRLLLFLFLLLQVNRNSSTLIRRIKSDNDSILETVDVVAIIPDRHSVFRNKLHNSLLVNAERNNVTLRINHYANYDLTKAETIFQDAIESNKQPKVYIIWPFHRDMYQWMRSLHEAHNTTMVQINTYPDDDQWEYVTAFAGQDAFLQGELGANMMIDTLKLQEDTNNHIETINVKKVAVFAFPESYPRTSEILKGFQDGLDDKLNTTSSSASNLDIEITDIVYSDSVFSPQLAYINMINFHEQLTSTGRTIDAIFCMDDAILTGVYQALQDIGHYDDDDQADDQKIQLVGSICNGARELLENGKQAGTSVAAPYLVGKHAMMLAMESVKNNGAIPQDKYPHYTAMTTVTGSTSWETTFVDFLGEINAVDDLCTWNTNYDRVAGLSDVHDVDDICQYIDCEYIPQSLIAVGYCMTAINFMLALVGGTLVYYHRKKAVFQLAQPFFLGLVILSSTVDTSSIIFLSMDNQKYSNASLDVSCAIWPWLFVLGYSMTTSALITKIRRVRNVCMADGSKNQNLRKRRVSVKQASLFMVPVLVIDIIILSIWYAINLPQWDLTVSKSDSKGYIEEAYGTCSMNYIFPLVFFLFHLGLLLYGNRLVYQTYHLHKISDSKYVAISLFNTIQLLIVTLPLVYLFYDNVAASYLIKVCFIFLNNFWVLILVVYTKIYVVYAKEGGGNDIPDLHNMRSTRTRRISRISAAPSSVLSAEEKLSAERAQPDGGGGNKEQDSRVMDDNSAKIHDAHSDPSGFFASQEHTSCSPGNEKNESV